MPVTRAGWLSVLTYVIVIIGAALYLLPDNPEKPSTLGLITFLLIVVAATLIVIGLCYAKGPVPRWRWGTSDSDRPDEDF